VTAEERAALLSDVASAPVEAMTPIDAMNALAALRERARKTGIR
jgi:hypothetical protein